MPKDKSWNWPTTANSWDNANKAKPNRSKGKGKSEPAGPAFPNYDIGTPSELSSSASSSKDADLKAALTAVFVENKLEVPKELQSYLQPKPVELIQSDQKLLNAKRKLLNKVDRLSKALTKKQEQWQSFRMQMREHLAKEQTRYESEVQDLRAAIDTTQAQLAQLMAGKDPEKIENAEMETEVPLEDLLGTDVPVPTATLPTETTSSAMEDARMEELRLAHANQQQMAKQLQELQQQMVYMTAALMPPGVGSPSTIKPTALQNPFTPMKTRAAAPKGPYTKMEPEAPPLTETQKEKQQSFDIEEISD